MPEKATVSVGICAHNEQETLGKLLNQVLNENIPLEEIIVIVAGNDDSADIVADKEQESNKITLIQEDEREGQTAAQNKILDNVSGDALIFLDGDGLIKKGSLEILYDRYNGDNIVSGKEIPITTNSFLGNILDVYGEAHHKMCNIQPRFATHLGIVPSNLIESFPEIILDDSYIEHRALEEDLSIIYQKNAVKHHKTPNSLRFFFHQQKKNWTGRFQIEKMGLMQSKSSNLMIMIFLKELLSSSFHKIPALISLAVIELAAYITGKYLQFRGNFRTKWVRP